LLTAPSSRDNAGSSSNAGLLQDPRESRTREVLCDLSVLLFRS
jgi:hypothetical protein